MQSIKQHFFCILSIYAALAVTACASMEPGQVSTETSAPTPVDPIADNAAVIAGQTAGLVVTLSIDGERVQLVDARVMLIPKGTARRQEGELVSLAGLRGGEVVTRLLIPDQRINVQENRGIVIQDQRTLNAALPLPAPIDELQVQLPGAEQPVKFAVGKKIRAFCGKHPEQDICIKSGEDMHIVK